MRCGVENHAIRHGNFLHLVSAGLHVGQYGKAITAGGHSGHLRARQRGNDEGNAADRLAVAANLADREVFNALVLKDQLHGFPRLDGHGFGAFADFKAVRRSGFRDDVGFRGVETGDKHRSVRAAGVVVANQCSVCRRHLKDGS